jgi:hypothetical protein
MMKMPTAAESKETPAAEAKTHGANFLKLAAKAADAVTKAKKKPIKK